MQTMKKFLLAILCVLPVVGLSSCSDNEKDLPNVDFNLTVSGGEVYEDQLYLVTDSTLTIDAINVVNNEQGKTAFITYANYYLDGQFIGRSVIPPFGIKLPTPVGEEAVGQHSLVIACPVYAVDKEVAFGTMAYTLNVVATPDDMPTQGQTSHTTTPKIDSNEPSM